MLKYIGLFIILSLLSISPIRGQQNVRGSGYILTQQRETGFFHSIEVSRNISVFIVQGELQPVTIEADDNLFPYIKMVVRDNILKVYIPDTINIVRFTDMNVLISMPSISTLMARQFSTIDGSPQIWNAKNIELKASTGSRIKLATHASAIKISAQTSAIIELKGKCEQLEAELKTAARLYARNLETDKAQLQLATGAKAEVKVNGAIDYNLSGNARLEIRGNPTVIKSEVNSGSKIIRDR